MPAPYFNMISIVIPTLNEEKYLPLLLESIKKQQEFSDYEVIVSDGGSTDKTVMLAEQYQTRVIIDTKIKCPAAQRNNGAKIATGDILLFLDADSIIEPNFLKIVDKQFKERNLIGAGFYFRFNPNYWYYNFYSCISRVICGLKQYSRNPASVGAAILSSRQAHNDIGGFDLSVVLAEDYDYCARLANIGKFRMIKKARFLYSSRRMQKEGFWPTGWKWLKMGLYTLTNRKIKKKIIKYDFGNF